MNKYHIPQHLDAPFKIIIWTADEFLVFVIPFALCLFILNAPVTGVIFGGICMMLLKKLKGDEGLHFIWHLMYWYLPPVVSYRCVPPSYLREILG